MQIFKNSQTVPNLGAVQLVGPNLPTYDQNHPSNPPYGSTLTQIVQLLSLSPQIENFGSHPTLLNS